MVLEKVIIVIELVLNSIFNFYELIFNWNKIYIATVCRWLFVINIKILLSKFLKKRYVYLTIYFIYIVDYDFINRDYCWYNFYKEIDSRAL